MRVYLCACKTKELVSINNIYQLYIFLCDIYCITILFFYCSKVQYLVDILIKAKALVLNRNYISTHSVMQMKKKSYIKFYFSFIYNYLNWLSYIHRKKSYKKNNYNHKYYFCFIFYFFFFSLAKRCAVISKYYKKKKKF